MDVEDLRLGLLQVLADIKLQEQERICTDQGGESEETLTLDMDGEGGVISEYKDITRDM